MYSFVVFISSRYIFRILRLYDFLFIRVQSAGLGGLKPNTVMLSWPHDWKNDPKWQAFIRKYFLTTDNKHNVVVPRKKVIFFMI